MEEQALKGSSSESFLTATLVSSNYQERSRETGDIVQHATHFEMQPVKKTADQTETPR